MYYAAMIAYVLQDMRPCEGPFSTHDEAAIACLKLDNYTHEPYEDVKVGGWFAVHGPGYLSCVMGSFGTKDEAENVREKNQLDQTIGAGDSGFVASVVSIEKRSIANGYATHVVLKREP